MATNCRAPIRPKRLSLRSNSPNTSSEFSSNWPASHILFVFARTTKHFLLFDFVFFRRRLFTASLSFNSPTFHYSLDSHPLQPFECRHLSLTAPVPPKKAVPQKFESNFIGSSKLLWITNLFAEINNTIVTIDIVLVAKIVWLKWESTEQPYYRPPNW